MNEITFWRCNQILSLLVTYLFTAVVFCALKHDSHGDGAVLQSVKLDQRSIYGGADGATVPGPQVR